MRLLIALSFLALTLPAWAQLYPSSSQDISEEEAQMLFSDLKNENAKMEEKSECFERAHMWALRAERVHQITMEKVYLFFTYKFQMKHVVTGGFFNRPFTWWFHVAPAVRVNGELWVMDATFTDKAMPLQEWTGSLMKNPEVCQELNEPQDYVIDRNSTNVYRNVENAKHQCYFTTAPKSVYMPLEIGFYEDKGMKYRTPTEPSTDWRPATFNWALQSYKRKHQKAARQALGF